MKRNEARKELKRILANQKTASTERLSRIMDAINIDEILQQCIEQGWKIKRQRERLRDLELELRTLRMQGRKERVK